MAKKNTTNEPNEGATRQSRKEVLRAQKQAEQLRIVKIAAAAVGLILLLVLIVAVVNEFFIVPNQTVASVNGEPITLQQWQDRVEYERAQRIMTLENQLESLNGDVGLVQQFSGQTIVELLSENAEGLGEAVLDRLVEEEVMRQAAEQRGLLPTDEDVQEQIEEDFNYFGGEAPPPSPEPTETVVPTPSLTPIPAEGEEPPTEAPPVEELPTRAPLPTPTPVSADSFQQEFDTLMADFNDLGVSEDTYRSVVKNQIITDRLMDALAEEEELPTEDVHASTYYIAFTDEEEANQALDQIESGDYLTVWNEIRSNPPDPTAEEASTASASEVLWRTRDSYEASFGPEASGFIFDAPLNTPSEIFTITGTDGAPVYLILQVSGRENRELIASEFEARKQQLLVDFLDERIGPGVEISELWRRRVPTSPVLDPKFRQAPTPAPDSGLQAPLGTPAVTPAP